MKTKGTVIIHENAEEVEYWAYGYLKNAISSAGLSVLKKDENADTYKKTSILTTLKRLENLNSKLRLLKTKVKTLIFEIVSHSVTW